MRIAKVPTERKSAVIPGIMILLKLGASRFGEAIIFDI